LKTLDKKGSFNPIFKIILVSIADFKLEYIFSYILGTPIKIWGFLIQILPFIPVGYISPG